MKKELIEEDREEKEGEGKYNELSSPTTEISINLDSPHKQNVRVFLRCIL